MHAIGSLAVMLCLVGGCCFDLTHVKKEAAQLQSGDTKPSWRLAENTPVPLESWSTTHLKAGTRWDYVGTLPQGDVYRTNDQIVTVVGSNVFEAYPVLNGGKLVGFYLPVEKAFSGIKKPIAVPITPVN